MASHELGDIPVQVHPSYLVIRPVEAALEHAPERLQAVRMDFPR